MFGHGFGTRLSSAGLVYKHFGRDVVASLLGLPPDDATVAAVYLRVYKTFMEAVDGGDNGVDRFAGPARCAHANTHVEVLPQPPSRIRPPAPATSPARYESHTDLASRVGRLNGAPPGCAHGRPTRPPPPLSHAQPFPPPGAWNEPFDGASQDARFARASTLAVDELAGEVRCAASVWLPGRAPVAAALAPPARAAAHPSGLVLRLASFCPWKEHLFDLEEEDKVDPKPLFVLFPDEASATWRVSTVPSAPGSFGMRRPLPAAWRGLRDGELAAASGVPGAVFVHATGFIGGAKTEQGARDMAAAALALEPDA